MATPVLDPHENHWQEGQLVNAPSPARALIADLIQSMGTADAEAAIRLRAQRTVEEYRAMFGDPTMPFPIEALASFLGIAVADEAPAHSEDAELTPTDGGRVKIRVNPDRPETRRRFSIGHEIAHTFFPGYEGKAWCRTDARHRRRQNPDEYLEMLCDVGSAELLMPSPWFQSDAARVRTAAELQALGHTYGVSREAMLRRFAESHADAVAAVFFSWKLKPAQNRTIGLQDQGRLFGDKAEVILQAKKLRVDYSIPSERFRAAGYFVPNDKSVASDGPLYAAAASGLPTDGTCDLDLGSIRGQFKVLALPVWTPDSDVGPHGENAVAAIVMPLGRENLAGREMPRRTLFE